MKQGNYTGQATQTFSKGNRNDNKLIIVLVSLELGAKAKYSFLASKTSKIWSNGWEISLLPTSTSISFRIYLKDSTRKAPLYFCKCSTLQVNFFYRLKLIEKLLKYHNTTIETRTNWQLSKICYSWYQIKGY